MLERRLALKLAAIPLLLALGVWLARCGTEGEPCEDLPDALYDVCVFATG